jgi:hypothetical protein
MKYIRVLLDEFDLPELAVAHKLNNDIRDIISAGGRMNHSDKAAQDVQIIERFEDMKVLLGSMGQVPYTTVKTIVNTDGTFTRTNITTLAVRAAVPSTMMNMTDLLQYTYDIEKSDVFIDPLLTPNGEAAMLRCGLWLHVMREVIIGSSGDFIVQHLEFDMENVHVGDIIAIARNMTHSQWAAPTFEVRQGKDHLGSGGCTWQFTKGNVGGSSGGSIGIPEDLAASTSSWWSIAGVVLLLCVLCMCLTGEAPAPQRAQRAQRRERRERAMRIVTGLPQ